MISRVKVNGPPKIVADHLGFAFVLVSPQSPEGSEWTVAILDRLLAR